MVLDRVKGVFTQPKESEEEKVLKINELRDELKTVKKDAKDKAAEIDQLRQNLRTARDEASQKDQRLTQQHLATVKSLDEELRRVKNAADMKERRMADEHMKAVNELNETHAIKMSRQEHEHQQTNQHLLDQYQQSEQRLLEKHQQVKEELQQENAELNEAWLHRDDEIYKAKLFTTSGLPSKPDDKIKNQVLELQQMVDDLSRTEWKTSPDTRTDRVSLGIGHHEHGQRLVKKAIVQDLIWSLLFRRIFCSPFRMFGTEGKNLEREWNEQCGKENSSGDELYTWPLPGIKTERWRYMTIKDCKEILSTPIPSVDRRAEIKRGFKTSQDELITVLENELGRVVQVTEQEIQLAERLVKKASVTWLDFAMHRCRIVICPTGAPTKSTADKVSTIQRGSVALTVVPTVGRYGNVRGEGLDRFTVIKEGSTLDVT